MNRGRPIRIAQVVGGLDRAGAETWLRNVLRLIDRDRFRMDFIVHDNRTYRYEEEVKALGARVIPCLHPERPWSHAIALRRLFEQEGRYDVVHSHLQHFNGIVLAAAAWAHVPRRIAHSHSSLPASDRRLPRALYVSAMTSFVRRYATGGLAASANAAAALFGAAWRDEPRWRLLHCGIDLDAIQAAGDREAARRALGQPPSTLVLGHVGRFDPEKNHALLLSIAREVVRRRPQTHLVLVGSGRLAAELEQEARRLQIDEHATFLGSRSDVAEILPALDVFVFPSLFEGLGLAAVEAQAAGVPVVMSDVLPEEATVVSGLVTRVSLSAPVAAWADAILAAPRPTSESRDRALAAVRGSPFDIRTSARALADYYAEG